LSKSYSFENRLTDYQSLVCALFTQGMKLQTISGQKTDQCLI